MLILGPYVSFLSNRYGTGPLLDPGSEELLSKGRSENFFRVPSLFYIARRKKSRVVFLGFKTGFRRVLVSTTRLGEDVFWFLWHI